MKNDNGIIKRVSIGGGCTVGGLAVILAIIFVFGGGHGNGKGDGTVTVQEESTTEPSERSDEQEGNSQDNDIVADTATNIKVSVVGNDYFYENERISLDDFITKIKEEGEILVEVRDDNASLKAYNSLINKLKEFKIPFTER